MDMFLLVGIRYGCLLLILMFVVVWLMMIVLVIGNCKWILMLESEREVYGFLGDLIWLCDKDMIWVFLMVSIFILMLMICYSIVIMCWVKVFIDV